MEQYVLKVTLQGAKKGRAVLGDQSKPGPTPTRDSLEHGRKFGCGGEGRDGTGTTNVVVLVWWGHKLPTNSSTGVATSTAWRGQAINRIK